MLAENQIKRILAHCQKIDAENENNKNNLAGDDYFEAVRNKGWCEALRLVMQKDTYPISNTPLSDKGDVNDVL